jgi:transcriptional regulator GlxA family with amidase domain
MGEQTSGKFLESTNEPVDFVRGRVGYGDPAAFRRAFKDSAGLSPSQYRSAYGLGAALSDRGKRASTR